jgi:hypothetical protein
LWRLPFALLELKEEECLKEEFLAIWYKFSKAAAIAAVLGIKACLQ